MGVLPGYDKAGYWKPLLLMLAHIVQVAELDGEVPNTWMFVAEPTPTSGRRPTMGKVNN